MLGKARQQAPDPRTVDINAHEVLLGVLHSHIHEYVPHADADLEMMHGAASEDGVQV